MKKRNRVLHRIDNDYAAFKKDILSMSQEDMYEYAYKIFCVEEFYIILMNGYEFSDRMIKSILLFQGNILEQIYDEWTQTDYSHQDPFKDVIKHTFAQLPERKVAYAA